MGSAAYDRDFLKLSDKWVRIVNKIDANERSPKDFGTGDLLHCSEIHTIMTIGKNPGINITGLSEILGISKSAISQMVTKLVQKGLVEKYREADNKKEMRLSLTPQGNIAYIGHEHHHAKIYAGMHKRLGILERSEYELLLRFLSAVEDTFDECEKKEA
ncbi:MAG: MarR family transcriptional regulator [Methanomicrobiaceae archaeon]|nr:MarR family transcriptional regulator [Methanomicrobiaceae archaeon]